MKILWTALALFAFASPAASFAAETPLGPNGQVTLSWEKFNDMWQKMQALEKKLDHLTNPDETLAPPVAFALTRAVYGGKIAAGIATMEAVFDVDVYEKKKWVKVPFLPSSVAVSDVRLNGEPVGVVQENGFHTLVLRRGDGSGRYIVRTRFTLKAPTDQESPELQFNIPQTPMTLIALEFPRPKLDVTIEPAQGTTSVTVQGKTRVTATLPSTSYIQIRWRKETPQETAGPSKLYLETQTLVSVSEGALRLQASLNYNIVHRGVRELRVALPSEWNVLSVTAEGLQEWKIEGEKTRAELVTQFAYERKGPVSLNIVLERGLGDNETVAEIPKLQALGIERETGTLGVEAKGSVEVEVPETMALQPMDPQELPGTLWSAAQQPLLFAYRYTKPYKLSVGVKRHPEVAVLTTTIDDANAVTLWTDRGRMVTRVRYQVRNHLKQYLSIRLPEGAELWSAFVSEGPVKPVRTENGAYRIPLAKSQSEMSGQAGFPVEIVYYQPTPSFGFTGYKRTLFPVPDAPVSRLIWSVFLPTKVRVLGFGGDVEPGEQTSRWSRVAGGSYVDRKDLLIPAAKESDRQRDELKSLSRRMAPAMANAAGASSNEPASMQMELLSDMAKGKVASAQSVGVFPVAFDIPSSGQLFHFGQVMMMNESPSLSLWYVDSRIIQTLCWMVLGMLVAAIVRWRVFLIKGLRSSQTFVQSRIQVMQSYRQARSRLE